MRWLFLVLIVVHGLIHFLGFAKAFGFYDAPQLTQTVTRPWGIVWFAAGAAILATGMLFIASSRVWWAVGLGSVALSQVAISSSWADARFGTVANLLVLAGVAYAFASVGPISFSRRYHREVDHRLAHPITPPKVTEADLLPLPEPVQRYLRQAGVVGQPRVHHVRAAWRGRIRAGADDPWMTFTAEQHNFPGEPSRFFLMKAKRGGMPVDVYHAFQEHSASMRVRLLSLVPMVDARGREMDRAETVTLLNDICLLAPAELVDPEFAGSPLTSTRLERTTRRAPTP